MGPFVYLHFSIVVTMENPMLTKTGAAKLHCFPFTIKMVIRLTGLALMHIFFLILVNIEIIRMENSNNNNNNIGHCGNISPTHHLNETSDSCVSPSSVTHNTWDRLWFLSCNVPETLDDIIIIMCDTCVVFAHFAFGVMLKYEWITQLRKEADAWIKHK